MSKKLKEQLTLKNVKSFFEAHARIVYDKFIGLPVYMQEQVAYRHDLCKDDCFLTNKCKYCGCDADAKAFGNDSCNNGERFPDMMNEEEWNEFKKNGYKTV